MLVVVIELTVTLLNGAKLLSIWYCIHSVTSFCMNTLFISNRRAELGLAVPLSICSHAYLIEAQGLSIETPHIGAGKSEPVVPT